MREIRQSGSEGGGFEFNRFSLPLSKWDLRNCDDRVYRLWRRNSGFNLQKL